MPMPHRTYKQVIQRRLVGKTGTERTKELRSILAELPGYRNGPYADLRKWVEGQMAESRVRTKVVHRDSIAVRREGAAQVMLVGPPNAGKSSLLQALSSIQIRTGDYAFTTTRPGAGGDADPRRPRPARRDPGPDRGRARGPRRRPCAAGRAPRRRRDRPLPRGRRARRRSTRSEPSWPRPGSRSRRSSSRRRRTRRRRRQVRSASRCSTTRASTGFARRSGSSPGLMRVWVRRPGEAEVEAVPLHPPATVVDVARAIHHELERGLPRGTRLGPVGAVRGPARRPGACPRRRRRG